MAAVCHLSKLKPPLDLELESRLLRVVLYNVFSMGTGKDTTLFQVLHKRYENSLDIMLSSLLLETPNTDKLQHLLKLGPSGPELSCNVGALLPLLAQREGS
ncbi:hypothetical protein G0U57_019967 [Chelydra serpentina]|uniref:Uncharacterized protein n=1 Tax=Chelydra serpentina TaxID=8475 RepID=A0A8T1SW80_CHESE|nr:hypothetical protein G0U57_019967 [Chelydra serpentina]